MADSLRTVIGTTLALGAVLTGVLILRGTRFAPEWLQPPSPAPSAGTSLQLGAPVLPATPPPPATLTAATDVPPPPTTASAEPAPSTAASIASATPEPSASAPQPVASDSAGKGRKPGAGAAAQRGEPEVVELPADFRYSPQGPGNLTFPVAPATASTGGPR